MTSGQPTSLGPARPLGAGWLYRPLPFDRWQVATVIWVFLSIAHLPLIHSGAVQGGGEERHSVGVYDLAVIAYGLILIGSRLRPAALRQPLGPDADFMLLHLMFIFYMIVSASLNFIMPIFTVLVVIKHLETLMAGIITYILFSHLSERGIRTILKLSFLSLCIWGIGFFASGGWWNIPLPFHLGSGGVMGGVMAAYILFYLVTEPKKGLPGLLFLLLMFVVLVLAQGRTQVLAFVAVGLIYVLNTRDNFRIPLLLIGFAVLAVGLPVLADKITIYGGNPLLLLLEPERLMKDGSLMWRIEHTWFANFDIWSSSPFSMMIGAGAGGQRMTDGLWANLLFNMGIIGLVMFLIFHILAALRIPGYYLVFLQSAIAAVTSELMFQSYRYLQVYVVIFVAMLVIARKQRQQPVAGAVARTGTGETGSP